MSFAPLIIPALAAVLVLWGVGAVLSWAVGLRGFWAVGAAPVFSLTLLSGSAVLASWAGVAWSPLPFVVVSIVVAAVIAAARLRFAPRTEPRGRMWRVDLWLITGLVAATVVIVVRFTQIVQDPQNISQTFDNIFHLNGVRYVLSEGDASSLRLGYMTSSDGSLPFYPAAWHALVALVVQISGAPIPVAVNAVACVTSALVWPAAAVLLVRTFFGSRGAVSIAAAAIAASLPAFPILLMDYGVLYPFQLSLAVLPVALAATARLVGVGHDGPQAEPVGTAWWILILVGIIPGLTLAHPGGFVAWLALGFPILAASFVHGLVRGGTRTRFVLVLAAAAYVVVGATLVHILRPPLEARGWPLQMRGREAVWQVLTVSPWYLVPAVVVALCVVAGLVWTVIERRTPMIVAAAVYLVGAGLFVTVAAMPWLDVRDWLTGSWYNNLPRLAAIFAVALVPVAAYGGARTFTALSAWLNRRGRLDAWSGRSRVSVGLAASLLFVLALQADGSINRAVEWAAPLYDLDGPAPLLSADEYALLQRLPDEVPEGVAVAGSPWTGASLASAISDRPVLMPHTLMFVPADVELINDDLAEAAPGAPVCDAVRDLDVGFVLDFGDREVHPGVHDLPGLDDLDTSPAVQLVDKQGEAKLYRVVGCG